MERMNTQAMLRKITDAKVNIIIKQLDQLSKKLDRLTDTLLAASEQIEAFVIAKNEASTGREV